MNLSATYRIFTGALCVVMMLIDRVRVYVGSNAIFKSCIKTLFWCFSIPVLNMCARLFANVFRCVPSKIQQFVASSHVDLVASQFCK